MGRRTPDPKKPRERFPLPPQRPWVKKSRKAEEGKEAARRKIKPWQRHEEID